MILATHGLIHSHSQDVSFPVCHGNLATAPKRQAEVPLGSEDIVDLPIPPGCLCLPWSLQLMMNGGAELGCKLLAMLCPLTLTPAVCQYCECCAQVSLPSLCS